MAEQSFKTVTKEEVLKSVNSGDAIIVNTLSASEYRIDHIKGSISMPLSSLMDGGFRELDRNRKIITYCASFSCNASRKAATFLAEKGFNAYAYEGGMKEWTESGLPLEEGDSP